MKVLVLGFYGKKNHGDSFFVEAFEHLFPSITFIFTDIITADMLQNVSAVFIGGGSFLDSAPNISLDAFDLLKKKKIFYLGIGVEGYIHPIHLSLLQQAQFVAIRSPNKIDYITVINPNTILIPDLVFSLQHLITKTYFKQKSILILPNISVVPKWNEPAWKHSSWEYFKSETAQFLDYLLENKYSLSFFAMSQNDAVNDDQAAAEIINKMVNRNNYSISQQYAFADLANVFSQYSTIITQRYHGIILAEMLNIPYISICHHDKLLDAYPNNGKFISYYGTNKKELIASLDSAINSHYSKQENQSQSFTKMVDAVNRLL